MTRALDTRAFYVCPRINPDGAEWALADKPKWVRSSTRPYPYDEDEIEGLTVEDIDGDGRILQMRIPDPNGLWKDHPEQPGLMVRRDPIETGGTYYRILPEGTVEDWDGYTLRVKKAKQGLDLNRNFPASWRQEFEQLGAGPYPTSEPEVRAVVSFIDEPSEHHRRRRRSTPGAACCCGRSSTRPTTRCTPRTCGSTRRPARRGPS